jgi:hypothetical protein
MGGRGSGSLPDDGSVHRGGRAKKSAVAVSGSGLPVKPPGMSRRSSDLWDRLNDLLAGVAFEQDSHALWRIAVLMERQEQLDELTDDLMQGEDIEGIDKAVRIGLAVERSLDTKCGKFGMTPRERQILLVPKEEEERDELEQLMQGRE